MITENQCHTLTKGDFDVFPQLLAQMNVNSMTIQKKKENDILGKLRSHFFRKPYNT